MMSAAEKEHDSVPQLCQSKNHSVAENATFCLLSLADGGKITHGSYHLNGLYVLTNSC